MTIADPFTQLFVLLTAIIAIAVAYFVRPSRRKDRE